MGTVVRRTLLGIGAVFLLLQLVPYGWDHSNPPVARQLTWPDRATEQLAQGACYACHSNETEWPAYSYVAPASWLVRHDVEDGRSKLNLSTVGGLDELHDAAEAIEGGSM